jgi:MtrB/PioB family decaheme-associated outer membrane protein
MRPKLISLLIANLFAVPAIALAQDAPVWSGSVSIGAQGISKKTQDDSKLMEYRDLDSGVLGGFEIRGRDARGYLDAYGENLGRDDQYLSLKGGLYDLVKYNIYWNEMRHRFGEGVGARSPFFGIGGGIITYPLPINANPATWNTFDHSYKRRDFGSMVEWQTRSPWYFRVEANQVKRDGVNVFAGANGTSPGNGFTDLPAPIEYTTNNISGEAGFSAKSAHFAVNLSHSEFQNDYSVLRWTNRYFNPAGGLLDTTTLPPDNKLTRIAINGNVRRLPGDSTLAGRLTYSRLTNSVAMEQTMLTAFTAAGVTTFNQIGATNPSSPTFEGKLRTTTASLSFSSHPMKALDTRVYWNYTNEKNDSTRMEFNPAAGQGLRGGAASGPGNNPPVNCDSGALNPCEPEFFHYKKNNFGVEASWKFMPGNKLGAGWDYYKVDRERIDFHSNKDNKVYIEYKNSMFDVVTGKIKYQYMTRRSNFSLPPGAIQANPIEPFVRRFDLANVDQNQVKLVLDVTPAPMMDIGFEAIYKNNDYKDTILGRTEDWREEYYLSFSFGDPRKLRFIVFGDVELTRYDSFHRVGVGNPDPATAPTAATYNWSARNNDRSWQVGAGMDWVPMERLKLSASALWVRTRGTADFALQPPGVLTGVPLTTPVAIQNFDNSTRTSLNLKGTYSFSKQWDLSAGYAYERYRYSDIGYDNTLYFIPSAASATLVANQQSSVATGQFSFQPYKANIFWVVGKFKF